MSQKNSAIDKLKKQREQLNARIQQMESRQKVLDRKKDTRRKILIGAFYWDKLIKDQGLDALKKELDSYLTRNSDRALFDLPLKEVETTE